jgi:cysteine-rich repeat protein
MSSYCIQCPTECSACSSSSVCTNCNNGYHLVGGNCNLNCGDSELDEFEECDDGNLDDGDGCDSTCNTELYFTCNYSPFLGHDQ